MNENQMRRDALAEEEPCRLLSLADVPNTPKCPICGENCRYIYRKSRYGDIIGCEQCICEVEANADADANPQDYGADSGILCKESTEPA